MPAAVRTLVVASLMGLVVVVGSVAVSFTDASVAAPAVVPSADASTGASPAEASAVSGQTLFGMDVPSLAQLDASESVLRVRPAIVGTFADWAHTPDFPLGFAQDVNRRGAIAMISWEPWDSWRGGADQPAYALRRIIAGDYDTLIDRWAGEIARYRRPVMLRFAAEMNGDWLPWSTAVNGNRPGDYVAAWRHVRHRFRSAGAANVVWVWNPTVAYDGSTPMAKLFPGANEIDWIAVDGYNWGATRKWGWQSYADIFSPTVDAFRVLAPRRPVMIAETGSAPDARKPAWVTATLQSARTDALSAVVWFEFNKETDWRLAGDPATARAARTVLTGRGWRRGGDLAAIEKLVTRGR